MAQTGSTQPVDCICGRQAARCRHSPPRAVAFAEGHPRGIAGEDSAFTEVAMPKKAIRRKIDTANEQIAAAHEALNVALRELQVLPRHEKTIISKVVGDAVARLALTQHDLIDLTALLAEADGAGRAIAHKK
jgi:hypothetical protein